MSDVQFQGDKPNATPHIIWSVVGVLTCTLFGVIGLVLSLMAKSKADAGDYQGAREQLRIAKIVLIVGAVLSVLAFLFFLVAGGLATFLGSEATDTLDGVGSSIEAP